jgi:TRAP-type C4-dicarboxylate transport system substrate-binding protein
MFLLLAGLLIAASCLWSCSREQNTESDTYKLTYSIFFPATHGQAKAGIAWAKEIEKRTEGRLRITIYSAGSLTPADQCYDGVVKGISDIGMSCFSYNRGRFPFMEVLDLPVGYPNGQIATQVANDIYQKFQPKELDAVKVLYLHAHGPGLLHTKKEVRSLEDLKGMKIRSTGLTASVASSLGAVPVAMPQGMTYESLQKGIVDGTIGPIEVLKGWKQAEVIKSTTNCAEIGYTTAMFVVMNKKKWLSLPPDIQAVIEEVNSEWIGHHGKIWDDLDKDGREFSLSQGNKIFPLTSEEGLRWKKAVQPVIMEFAENKGPSGQEALQEIDRLIKKYTVNPPPSPAKGLEEPL